MNKEAIQDESPYCEVCGTCGCIGCCGIRNFISEHIEGKTNCKNEGWIISELINLCEYKDKVFSENKEKDKEINRLNRDLDTAIDICNKRQTEIVRLNNIINELEKYINDIWKSGFEPTGKDIVDKLKELKEKSDKE